MKKSLVIKQWAAEARQYAKKYPDRASVWEKHAALMEAWAAEAASAEAL